MKQMQLEHEAIMELMRNRGDATELLEAFSKNDGRSTAVRPAERWLVYSKVSPPKKCQKGDSNSTISLLHLNVLLFFEILPIVFL